MKSKQLPLVGAFSLLSICVSLLSSCVTEQTGNFNALFEAGDYNGAAQCEIAGIGKNTDDVSLLLENLQAGAALRYSRNYEQSNEHFDKCEDFIKSYDEGVMSDRAKNVTAVFLSDAATDYRAQEYDGIMVNTYKAINYWQQGKLEEARVEFNRAVERQRRAKDRFAAEIAKEKEAIDKKQAEENQNSQDGNLDFSKSLDNPEVDQVIQAHYSNLGEFKKYPDFVNPFSTYMAGLFFMREGDYAKAIDLLKEAYGMMDENSVLKSDLYDCDRLASGHREDKNQVWVIFENGLCPMREEVRLSIPLYLVSDEVFTSEIALPRMVLRPSAYPYFDIFNNGQKLTSTEVVASMDRVIQTEFDKRFKMVLTRSIVSAIMKTFIQYQAQKKNPLLGTLAGAYQIGTTKADLRIWSALPKDFQVAKFDTPVDGVLNIQAPNGPSLNVNVNSQGSSLVYIKATKSDVPMDYTIIEF